MVILGMVMLHRGVSTRVRWKRTAWIVPVMVVLLVAMLSAGKFIKPTTDAAEAAEIRCAHIQHDMLSAQPRRADLPEIFEALGCHASGREDITFPNAPPKRPIAPK